MRHLLPEHANRPSRSRAARCAWVLIAACAGIQPARAAEASTNNRPAVVSSIVEPDAEVNVWLMRAADALRAGNADVALPLLKKVMQAEPAVLASTNGVTFRPARKMAAELIRALPEGLRDNASGNLPQKPGPGQTPTPTDLPALEALYRDAPSGAEAREAGLRLAGLHLDQGRFAEARRVLLELLDAYPSWPGPRAELLARLALACSRAGDGLQAQWAWAELRKEGDASRWSALEAEVRATASAAGSVSNAWTMANGGPSREGTPESRCTDLADGGGWAMRWGLHLGPGVIHGGSSTATNAALPPWFSIKRNRAVACMMEENMRPADEVIFAGNRAWVNGLNEFVAVDLESGHLLQRTSHVSDLEPGEADPFETMQGGFAWTARGGAAMQSSPAAWWLFGNRLNRAASLIGNRVYCIEENHRAPRTIRPSEVPPEGRLSVPCPTPCGNALVAYEAGSGRQLWRVGRDVLPELRALAPKQGVSVWNIPFIDGITVDGKLDDWRGRGRNISLTPISDAGLVWPGATVWLGWNDTGLLIRADVADLNIQESDDIAKLWLGDSIEMFLADRVGGSNSVQVVAGTGADPRHEQTRIQFYDRRQARPANASPTPAATAAGAPSPRGYQFEALVPWTNLGIQARNGTEAGFQLYINNKTNNYGMAAWFYPEGGTFSDTRKMHTIRLVNAVPIQPPPATRIAWWVNDIRFAAAPVPWAGLLLAPIEEECGGAGAIAGVVALNAETGAAVWLTRLVSKFSASLSPATPVILTVHDARVYLCSGRDSVSALDACDGSVFWTTLFDEDTAFSPTNDPVSNAKTEQDAWEEGLVQVAGETVVVLPEGSAKILALDRRTGARLWTRRKPEGVDYVVGRRGAALIMAGPRAAACVDLQSGQERWRKTIGGSTGRGALRGQEALIPYGRKIQRLRIEDGADLGSMPAQTLDDLPLGNLYVHGDQLLVAGLEQLYALTGAEAVLAERREQLARQPTAEGYAKRGRLCVALGRDDEAVADLREAWKRRAGSAIEGQAGGWLLTALWSAAAKQSDSAAAEQLHDEAKSVASSAAERAGAAWRLAQDRERTGNTNAALLAYAAILERNNEDAAIAPTLGDTPRTVSACQLAGQRIRTLLGGDAVRIRALLEEPAARALAGLGKAPTREALTDLAVFFPDTTAGREAAIKASRLAMDRGDLGIAEATLRRAIVQSAPTNRIALASELARLYERMKWPRGSAHLRDEWPRLTDQAPVPEFLAQAAAPPAPGALPPWRLRWRKSVPPGSMVFQIAGGLLYLQGGTNAGCLEAASGLPRWQKNLPPNSGFLFSGNEQDGPLLNVFTDNSSRYIDAWSGTVLTNRFRQPIEANAVVAGQGPASMLEGLALAVTLGNVLEVTDILTGRTIWRHNDPEAILDFQPFSSVLGTTAGLLLMSDKPDGSGPAAFAVMDLWTGAILARNSVSLPGPQFIALGRKPGITFVPEDADMLERGAPVMENDRLSVKNMRTDAVVWTSPEDIAVARHQVLPNGEVLVNATGDEILLLDGNNGKLRWRSRDLKFPFDYAGGIANGISLFHAELVEGPAGQQPNGTNEVVVLDPVSKTIAYRGRLSLQDPILMHVAPMLTNQLLVCRYVVQQQGVGLSVSLLVVDSQGQNTSGRKLPQKADVGDTAQYNSYFLAEGLILLFNANSGDLVAYEHDPGGGEK